LLRQIQKAANEAGLGVEIVFLGLQGLHPPPEVAADYQAVVGSIQKEQALILQAQAERNKNLSALVGSVEAADELYGLAARYQQAEDANNTKDLEKLGNELDTALEKAKGDIFKTISESQSYALEKATLAKATGERFASQLKAYRAAEDIYKRMLRLNVLEEGMKNIRKYVVVADPNDKQIIIIDVQEKLTPSIYDIGGLEESSE